MTAERLLEYKGKWGAPHHYHEGQTVKGITIDSGKPFVATILGTGQGFSIAEEDGKTRIYTPGHDLFEYKVPKYGNKPKNFTYYSFRLKAT